MIEKNEIEILKIQLAKLFENYVSKVANKANLSRPTVSKFFNFQKIKVENKIAIYDAGLEIIEEQTDKQQSRSRKARQLLNGDEQTSLKLNQ